jgi:hypothetical protein
MTVLIAKTMLDEARAFFEDQGAVGCEGTAMIAAAIDRIADRLIIPDQVSTPAPRCSVEVTARGKLELAAALGADERLVARIHSHPAGAFHSPTDDANPALTFEGALSIVVPFFGLGLHRGLNACAIYQYAARRWVPLPPGPRRDQVVDVR